MKNIDAETISIDIYESEVLFETNHSMDPTAEELKKAVVCPRCSSRNCKKSYHGSTIHGYIRGYGWSDKAGIRRDMNKFKLNNDDPYGQYRVPGEVDHINSTLKKEGQKSPGTIYNVPSKTKDES